LEISPNFTSLTNCRACGSTNLKKDILKKQYYLLNLDQKINLGYSICEDCHYVFQAQYVGDSFLNYYYKNSPMLRRKDPTIYENAQSKDQADFLDRHISLNSKSVLEIGAHSGAFLLYANQNYGCEVYFDELSEEARDMLLSQPGLKDAHSQTDLNVDIVVLRHVVEHIHDLNGFFAYVKKLLKKDAWLFIEVPDWSWLDQKTDPLNFEHLSQFSTHNLIHLMRRLGWNCEALEKSCNPDDPATPNRVQRLLFKPFDLISLGEANVEDKFLDFYRNHEALGFVRLNEILSNVKMEKKIALYPASHLTFSAIYETNLLDKNIVGMFDIDPKKHGKVVSGIHVRAASELIKENPDYIFLFTMAYEPEIRESFTKMGLTAKVISLSQILSADSATRWL
jgi:SAM-dependent methyltransferase